MLSAGSALLDARAAQPVVAGAGAFAVLLLLAAPAGRVGDGARQAVLLRRALRLLGAGLAVLVLTEVLRPIGGTFPTSADALALAGYPFVVGGLLCLTRARIREALTDSVLVAAIVPVSLGSALWLPVLRASGASWVVPVLLPVDLLAVTMVLRLAVISRHRTAAYQLLVGAFGCVLGALVARTAAAVGGLVPAPFGSQTLLLLGFGLVGAAALHPSLPRAVQLVPTAPPGLGRGHLTLLVGAVLAGPAVAVLGPDRTDAWRVVAPAVVSLLVVAHLARLLSERVRLEHASTHDALTELPHRARFNELLAAALVGERAERHGLAVMFIDLDDFKTVNDRMGHASGDAVLRSVAARLRESVRPRDVVARLGGDEFAVLLEPGTTRAEAVAVAERLLAALGAPVALPTGSAEVTPSIGIAVAPEDGDDADTLVRNADSAMYRAKTAGRNRIQVYDKAIGEQVRGRLSVQSRLRAAIEQDELVLRYQPKVDLRTSGLAGVEALVRWQHPTLGLISPGAFISQAERSGLIAPLGEWVMRTACRQAEQWRRDGLGDVPVSVNISPRQFAFHDVPDVVRAALDDSGLPPHLLEVEPTESVSLGGSGSADTIRQLDALGVQCSIDDFGTGYSSISYLHDYRVGTLKIDRSFVGGISRNDRDGHIVRAVIAMAHSLGIRVVAEGVETPEQTEFLRRHGCDLGQGYLFGRPGSVGSIRSLLEGLPAHPQLSDRPMPWDEGELGQRLWLEEQHLVIGDVLPHIVDVTELESLRAGAQRGLVLLTAASGVVVPLLLGAGAASALPSYVQVTLDKTLAQAGISRARPPQEADRSTLLDALPVRPERAVPKPTRATTAPAGAPVTAPPVQAAPPAAPPTGTPAVPLARATDVADVASEPVRPEIPRAGGREHGPAAPVADDPHTAPRPAAPAPRPADRPDAAAPAATPAPATPATPATSATPAAEPAPAAPVGKPAPAAPPSRPDSSAPAAPGAPSTAPTGGTPRTSAPERPAPAPVVIPVDRAPSPATREATPTPRQQQPAPRPEAAPASGSSAAPAAEPVRATSPAAPPQPAAPEEKAAPTAPPQPGRR